MDLQQKSKKLSYILRHNPEKFHINLDANCYALVTEIIEKTNISHSEIEKMVSNDEKQQYSYSLDRNKIKASN
jgi:putative RNA 2'-phosphotransferase